MKQYKIDIIDKLAERSKDERIIPLKDTAAMVGVKRLTTQEAKEVLRAAEKLTGYAAVQIVKTGRESLWESGALIDTAILAEVHKDES